MANHLTTDDVKRLIENPSAEARAETAGKVAAEFAKEALSDEERRMAEDIFRVLMRDAEVRVRRAMSDHVKEAGALPHDIAVSLASDEDEVALPMLRSSEVLSEDDLIEIVRTQGAAKQQAIAARDRVGSELADALVNTENEEVVATLVSNPGAAISESSLTKVLDDWGDNERFHQPLVQRPSLPIAIAEQLVYKVSEKLQEQLVTRHELPPALASDLILQSRERATIGLLSSDSDAVELVKQLRANDRLTPTIMLRAVCVGDMAFFEAALAARAQVTTANVRTLIHDAGRLGLKGIYEKAGLPPVLYRAFRVAVDVVREMQYDGEDHDRERFARRAIERILTQFEDLGAENIEYLLTKLTQIGEAGSPPAAHA